MIDAVKRRGDMAIFIDRAFALSESRPLDMDWLDEEDEEDEETQPCLKRADRPCRSTRDYTSVLQAGSTIARTGQPATKRMPQEHLGRPERSHEAQASRF